MLWAIMCEKAHCRKGCSRCRCRWSRSLSLSLSSSTAHHPQCDATAIVTVATAVAAFWWCSVWRMHSNHPQDMQQHSISLSHVHLHISEEENHMLKECYRRLQRRTTVLYFPITRWWRESTCNLQLAVVMLSSSSSSSPSLLRCINYALMKSVRLAIIRTCVSKAGEQPLVMVIGASYE